MLLHLTRVLDAEQIGRFRVALTGAAWVDGRTSAGDQAARAKNNLQVPEDSPEARALGAQVLDALAAHVAFMSAAMPARVSPPMFNRYGVGMAYGPHVDNALRPSPATGGRLRTDLSATLFLSDPSDYEGGELIIEADAGASRVKLPAGDMVLYPATSVHQVSEVTRGERLAAVFWVQSMIADPTQRRLLYDLDLAVGEVRSGLGDDHPTAVTVVGLYHRLMRLWAQP